MENREWMLGPTPCQFTYKACWEFTWRCLRLSSTNRVKERVRSPIRSENKETSLVGSSITHRLNCDLFQSSRSTRFDYLREVSARLVVCPCPSCWSLALVIDISSSSVWINLSTRSVSRRRSVTIVRWNNWPGTSSLVESSRKHEVFGMNTERNDRRDAWETLLRFEEDVCLREDIEQWLDVLMDCSRWSKDFEWIVLHPCRHRDAKMIESNVRWSWEARMASVDVRSKWSWKTKYRRLTRTI